jgi:hypothetical protein
MAKTRNAMNEDLDKRRVHYTQLKPFSAPGPLNEEWDTYRPEVSQMIADGFEGKFVLKLFSVSLSIVPPAGINALC